METLDVALLEIKKAKLFYELTNEDSTHYELLKAFEELVVAYKWCGLEEIREAFEDYSSLVK